MYATKRKLEIKYAYLLCLLLCTFGLKAQLLRDTSVFPSFGTNKLMPLFTIQLLLSESPSDILPSSAYLASAFPDTGSVGKSITDSEKSLLFEAPEGGGIPLGTPVKEAMLFLICLTIFYGIINRQKIHLNN